MRRLLLLATDESPQIIFDPSRGMLDISGKSLPENINEFYDPLEQAVQKYVESPQPLTTINFDLIYLNSSSTKRILSIIKYFEDMNSKGFKVVFNWYHSEFDEDMKDEGDAFSRLTELPLNIIAKSEK
jgi:hypothetical protein